MEHVWIRRWARRAGPLALVAIAATVLGASPAAASSPAPDAAARGDAASRVTAVTVTGAAPVGTFNGAAYVRIVGRLTGTVGPREAVVGLAALPKDASGDFDYSAQFELVTAAPGQPRSDGVVVEAENRGNPFVFDGLQGFVGLLTGAPAVIQYPAGLGNGFLQNAGLAWARVQWQGPNGVAAPINPTVPATAQGVGEVIVRDFGLLLRGADGRVGASAGLPAFDRALLVGVSQSAWFVDTFIAEGFNAAPRGRGVRRVFAGAYTQDGVGNWLGLNQINQAEGFAQQTSYVEPNGVPLTPSRLLSHPATDPFLVDTTAYTDFFRVRASIFNTSRLPANLREYDQPNAHSSAAALAATTTATSLGCAAGATPIPALNPLDGRPFARADVLELARRAGVRRLRAAAPALPPSTRFRLTAGPTAPDLDNGNPALPLFNFLPGHTLLVPVADANNQPLGGVTYPDAALTLGVPGPVSVPPVATRSITDTCGNLGGWRPFTQPELAARYGSVDRYVARYSVLLDRLIAQGRVLESDRTGVLAFVRGRFVNAPAT
jgi:hypothetical protein